MPHCGLEGDYSCEQPKIRYAEGGRLFKLSFGRSPAAEWNSERAYKSIERRGKCRGFSFGSRRRMLDRLNSVSCAAENPEMVTLTLPDDMFDDSVTRFAAKAKRWLDGWLKRLHRVCSSACGFWRIEWKARLSGLHEGKLFPHFHLLVWGLPVRQVWGQYRKDGTQWEESFVLAEDRQGEFLAITQEACGVGHAADFEAAKACYLQLPAAQEGEQKFFNSDGYYGMGKPSKLRRWDKAWSNAVAVERKLMPPMMSFRDWCALSWYHVVDSHNLNHFMAGVTVERVRSFAGVAYCAKAYLSKVDAESFLSEVEFGRSWGIFNRALMPWAKIIEMDLSQWDGVRIRRIARHFLEHRLGRRVKRPYGVTLYCNTSQWSRLLARPPDTPF